MTAGQATMIIIELIIFFRIECLWKLLQAFLRLSSTCQKGNILLRHLQVAKHTTSEIKILILKFFFF